MEERKFRVNAKNFLITYSRCAIEPETMYAWFSAKEAWSELLVGREKHADGGWHLHVYLKASKKLNVVNPRRWDVQGHHPNIQAAKSPHRAREYCMKEGNVVGEIGYSPHNFQRNYADYQSFMAHRRSRARRAISWPIRIPGGGLQLKPTASTKKCNWWIVGESDVGKTRWFYS